MIRINPQFNGENIKLSPAIFKTDVLLAGDNAVRHYFDAEGNVVIETLSTDFCAISNYVDNLIAKNIIDTYGKRKG